MSSRWRDALRHGLALRLGVWYAGLFVVSALAVSLFTYLLLARALIVQDHDVLAGMLARYIAEYRAAGLPGLQRLIDADAGEGRHERLLVRVVGQAREVVYFAEPPGWSDFDLTTLDAIGISHDPTVVAHDADDGSALEVVGDALGDGLHIQVGRSSRVRDEVLEHFRARALEIVFVIALIAMIGGALLTHAALAPVREMQATLRSILETGRFDARVAGSASHDPLDELGRLIDEMLGRIQVLVGGMRGALDNVAHDLRTPLTRLRNVAETALLSSDTEAVRDGLGRALEEAGRVNATLTALMDISQAETGTMKLVREPVVLSRVVDDAVALFADEAEDLGVDLRIDVPPGLEVIGDRTRLRQVVANLVENAVKYSSRGGRIVVKAEDTPGGVMLSVSDTGIGIAPSDLPLIWDRLYRADASRSTRGLGLGLSLVKAVVEAHGGRVSVTSEPGKGSTFVVVLPQVAS